MNIEDELEPIRMGGELLIELASNAFAAGQNEKGKELVIRAIRQGLILRHMKQVNRFCVEEAERIMDADPEKLYEIFIEEGSTELEEDSPINGLNYADIRQTLEGLI